MDFITNKVGEVAAMQDHHWSDVQVAAARFKRARIIVESYSEEKEISDQQRKWLHCKDGPIRERMKEGWSFREAKEYVKTEYGREWFVVELDEENINTTKGVFRWECRNVDCRKVMHPMDVDLIQDELTSEFFRFCPNCWETKGQINGVYPIAIRSIMDVSVKKTNMWFDENFAHMPKIKPPDSDWKESTKK